jgi:hypothetical protein
MSYSFPSVREIDEGYTFGKHWDEDAYRDNNFHYPNVCYKYLQMNGDYGFGQNILDNKDAKAYFESMKILAEIPIGEFRDLNNNKEEEWHMYPNPISKGQKLYDELAKVFGENLLKKHEVLPPFFHFALYQDKGVIADRANKVRAPRIYFFIGDNAAIYPMFYDPYHELNPMNEEKKSRYDK